MQLKDVLASLRAKWRLLLGGVLIGLLAGAGLGWVTVPTYQSSMQLFVSVASPPNLSSTDPAASAYQNDAFSQARIVSYVQVLTGEQLAQRVVDQLNLPLTAKQLAAEVTANPLPGTVIIDVTVKDASAQRAQAIARALQLGFEQRVDQLETHPGTTVSSVEVNSLEDPSFEATPVSPNVPLDLALGGALGLLLGLALALIRARTDTKVRTREDVRRAARADVVAVAPEQSRRAMRRAAEGARLMDEPRLGLVLDLPDLAGTTPAVVVTSAVPDEGKSTVAVDLALSLVRTGYRVILLDCNLYRPRVHRYLGLEDGPGLTDVLAGRTSLRQVARTWTDPRLTVVPAGPMPPNPQELVGSSQLRSMVKILRDTQDVLVIDAPPLLPIAETAALCRLADGCLLVTRYGETEREQLAEAAASLRRMNLGLLGVVLNRAPRTGSIARARRRGYTRDPDRNTVPLEAPGQTSQGLDVGGPTRPGPILTTGLRKVSEP